MTLSDLEDVAKLLSERHVAIIYAHNADELVRVMIGTMGMTIYSRVLPLGSGFSATVAGITVISQPFLLPGTALMIDQYGQIMQVCRYQDDPNQDDPNQGESSDG